MEQAVRELRPLLLELKCIKRRRLLCKVVPDEISNTVLRRLSAACAVDSSVGAWPPEVVKGCLAFLILAAKPPQFVFKVGHDALYLQWDRGALIGRSYVKSAV